MHSLAQAEVQGFANVLGERVPGRVMLTKLWGSRSHNVALPSSDTDYLAIYVAWNDNLLGLDPPAETFTGNDPDYEAHEVGKFCRLLLKGNPGIIETLFTAQNYVVNPVFAAAWESLREMRQTFLTRRTVEAYLGYAKSQLARLEGGKSLHTKGGEYNEKWAYHTLRLLQNARRVVHGEEPVVLVDGNDRRYLLGIREGRINQEDALGLINIEMNLVKVAEPWDLPKHADSAPLNRWLLEVRHL